MGSADPYLAAAATDARLTDAHPTGTQGRQRWCSATIATAVTGFPPVTAAGCTATALAAAAVAAIAATATAAVATAAATAAAHTRPAAPANRDGAGRCAHGSL